MNMQHIQRKDPCNFTMKNTVFIIECIWYVSVAHRLILKKIDTYSALFFLCR